MKDLLRLETLISTCLVENSGRLRWESTQFNSRLQPTQIGLGSSATNRNLLKLNYDYGTTDNNGNVKSQTITVPTVGANTGFTAIQNYTYDSLNRLKSAVENINGSQTPSWKQTFTFDRYGNRNFDTANTTTIPSGCQTAVCNPTVDPATNKLVGYQFDNVGNTKVDANGQTFIYDAENKQVQVNSATGIVGQYSYDGDGKRIKKVVPSTGETTTFVYDAAGKSIAEYSTIVADTANAKVAYLTNDHLGSPRITTDANGQTISRRDFMPFGEEISGLGGRTTALGYSVDKIRQKFTGYERDTETDLDFAQARMYSNNVGRFMVADPLLSSGKPVNPQCYNRYSYVGNSPFNFTDPTGLIWYSRYNEKDKSTSFRWYGKGEKVGKNFHIYMGTREIALGDGSGKSLFLNEAGPNKNGKDEWGKNGWIVRTPSNSVQQGIQVGTDTMEGSKNVTLDLVLAADGIASLPEALGAAANFFARTGLRSAVDAGESLPSTLFHYTNAVDDAAAIEASQLGRQNALTFLTNNGNLTPLQAQIELSLGASKTADAVFAVDSKVIETVNIVKNGRVVGNVNNRAGGGTEIVINQVIPKGSFRRVQ